MTSYIAGSIKDIDMTFGTEKYETVSVIKRNLNHLPPLNRIKGAIYPPWLRNIVINWGFANKSEAKKKDNTYLIVNALRQAKFVFKLDTMMIENEKIYVNKKSIKGNIPHRKSEYGNN